MNRSAWFTLFLVAGSSALAADHEVPGPISLDSLPENLRQGTNFTVVEPIENDGFINSYSLQTPFGEMRAVSRAGLCKMVREANAIAEIRRFAETDTYKDSLSGEASQLADGAKALFTDPGAVLGGAVTGIGKAFKRLGSSIKHGNPRGETEDNWAQSLIGYSSVKRDFAFRLGVDVYSHNEILQDELDRLAWIGYSGGATIMIASTVLSGGAALAYTFTNSAVALNELIKEKSPNDLRDQNRDLLEELGMGEDLIDLFIGNTRFSPTNQTFLVHALKSLDGTKGRNRFLRSAVRVESTDAAFLKRAQAQFLAGYHANQTRLVEFIEIDRYPLAIDAEGRVVGIAAIDHLFWTEDADHALTFIDQELSRRGYSGERHLWLTGEASEAARAGIAAKKWTLHTDAEKTLLDVECDPDVPELQLTEVTAE